LDHLKVQRQTVLAHHPEQSRGIIAGKIPACCHGCNQPNRLLKFPQLALVNGVTFQEMIAQDLGGPNPELGTSVGI
jgi:hypothetical protein